MTDRARAVVLASLVLLSAVVGFAGTAAAASNVSISPADDAPGATTTYTAEGNVEMANQDTLQYVDVHLEPADVGAVGQSDVSLFIDGDEYTDGFSQFDASSGTVEFKLANSRSVSDGDPIRVEVAGVTNPSSETDFDATITLHDTGDAKWQTFDNTVSIEAADDPDPSTPPTISDFSLETTADGELSLYFTSSEALADIEVGLSGPESQTLTGAALDERQVNGDYTYSLIFDAPPGAYEATLERAVDDGGDDGASGQSSTASVAYPTLAVANGTADPSTVEPNTTISNQQVTVDVANLSADGDTDTLYAVFPNALADTLSVNGVSVTNASVAQSAEVVDGFDDDGVQDTVRFQTDADSGGAITATVTVDVSVHYPIPEREYPVDVRVLDSTGRTVTETGAASVTVQDRPAVEDFAATVTDAGAISLSMTATEPLASAEIGVTGPENVTLTRANVTEHDAADGVPYTATLSDLAAGTYHLTLHNATDDQGLTLAETHSATATVLGSGTADAHVGASPRTVGDGSATHTVVTRVTADSALANQTLTGVTVAYGAAYRDAEGSVSSVSDDQNVVTLRVVGPDGTERATLGGTDAVTVNVENGAVRLDLSDVDSARRPTLSVGDRVIVGLRPATNPSEPGRYDVNVTLRGPAGAADHATATLDVLAADGIAETASHRVSLDSPSATLAFGGSALTGVTVSPATDAVGWVTVHRLAAPPAPVDAAEGEVLSVIDVRTPAPSDGATLSFSLDAAGVDADRVTLVRHGNPSWAAIESAEVEASDGTLTVTASVDHTSVFAVVAADAAGTDTATATASATDTVTPTASATDTVTATATATQTETAAGTTSDENESGGTPGFTVAVALTALLTAAILRRRR